MKYKVYKKEVWEREFIVEAGSTSEAFNKVAYDHEDCVEGSLNFGYTLSYNTWEVYEIEERGK